MSKTIYKFKLDRKGVRELLQSEWAMEVVESKANEVLSRVGDGYEVDTFTGKKRVNASVRTKTLQAVMDNAEHNTLLKALR